MSDALRDLLKPQRLTAVVDVGANPIDGDPPYKPLLDAGLCQVTGFEPQPDALAELQKKKSLRERYLPYVVGDGKEHTFNICRASGMSSLLEPNLDPLSLGFDPFREMAEVIARLPVRTRRLDDIKEIKHLDFLKIDVQGGELSVFQGGYDVLEEAVAIQAEVSFMPLYHGQPLQGVVDLELRQQGFVPHCFALMRNWPIFPAVIDGDPTKALNQLFEADMVYVRDFTRAELMTDEQLKHLALIAHHCYQSVDLALRCVMLLEERKALKAGAQQRYLEIL